MWGQGEDFPWYHLLWAVHKSSFLGIDSVRKKDLSCEWNVGRSLSKKMLRCCGRGSKTIKEKRQTSLQREQSLIVINFWNEVYPLLKRGGYLFLWSRKSLKRSNFLLQLCKKYHLTLEQERKYQLFESDIMRVLYVLRKE